MDGKICGAMEKEKQKRSNVNVVDAATVAHGLVPIGMPSCLQVATTRYCGLGWATDARATLLSHDR